ncbi:MAG: hypothetical protein CL797_09280, partial [Chromatiales bacterium]|nr:hypothetical protein [Chromatiales bacterium]
LVTGKHRRITKCCDETRQQFGSVFHIVIFHINIMFFLLVIANIFVFTELLKLALTVYRLSTPRIILAAKSARLPCARSRPSTDYIFGLRRK